MPNPDVPSLNGCVARTTVDWIVAAEPETKMPRSFVASPPRTLSPSGPAILWSRRFFSLGDFRLTHWRTSLAWTRLQKMQANPYFVRAEWDEEAQVWVATSDDVPGLVTEADTVEALLAKLRVMIPELLEANGQCPAKPVPFELLSRRFETIPHRAA